MNELLEAIVENPRDDAPRRVYADALLDRGDPYGEFINLQLDLAGDGLGRDERLPRRVRERELLKTHGPRWIEPLEGIVLEPCFRRGFVDEAAVPVETLASEEVLALAPLLRVVTTGVFDTHRDQILREIDALSASPVLRKIEGVRIGVEQHLDTDEEESEPFPEGIERFAQIASRFPQLVAFAPSTIREEALRRFIRSDLVRRLVYIDLSQQAPDDASTILDAIPIGQLRGIRFTWRWSHRLLAEPLRSLAFEAGSRPELLRLIANTPAFVNLRELDLGRTHWDTVEQLAHAERLDALRVLRFEGPINQFQIASLLEWPIAKRLEVLDLRGIGDAALHRGELSSRFDGILLAGDLETRTGALGGCW